MKTVIIVHGPPGSGLTTTAKRLMGVNVVNFGKATSLITPGDIAYEKPRNMVKTKYDFMFLQSQFSSLQEELKKAISKLSYRIIVDWYFPFRNWCYDFSQIAKESGYKVVFREPASYLWCTFREKRANNIYARDKELFCMDDWVDKLCEKTSTQLSRVTISKMLYNFPYDLTYEDLQAIYEPV